MVRSLTVHACVAALSAGSATSSSATRPTRQPFADASARSGSGVSAGLSECGAAWTATPCRQSLAVLVAHRCAGAHATSRTTPRGAATAGPGNGRARRCWSEMDTAAWHAAPPMSGSRSTTSCLWRPEARTSSPTCERCAPHATGAVRISRQRASSTTFGTG